MEISNRLGLETTHLDSKLKDPHTGLIWQLGQTKAKVSGHTVAATLICFCPATHVHHRSVTQLSGRAVNPCLSVYIERDRAGQGFEGGVWGGFDLGWVSIHQQLRHRRPPSTPPSLPLTFSLFVSLENQAWVRVLGKWALASAQFDYHPY